MAAISNATRYLDMPEYIIEKDYWITMLLKKVTNFEYSKYTVFKGGTSLSKGFKLISRFSEDVDVSVKHEAFSENGIHKKSGEAIHKIIKKIKIEHFKDSKDGKESESQRYKRVYEFPRLFQYPAQTNIHQKIVLEVNSFSEPAPTENVQIISLVGSYIQDNLDRKLLEESELVPFDIVVLAPERTFCEKLLALRRAFIKGKDFFEPRIRHVSDIHQLYQSPRIKIFLEEQEKFEKMLYLAHKDDQLNQKLTKEHSSGFSDIQLFSDPINALLPFEAAYKNLQEIFFAGQLSEIGAVAETIKTVGKRLKGFSFIEV